MHDRLDRRAGEGSSKGREPLRGREGREKEFLVRGKFHGAIRGVPCRQG